MKQISQCYMTLLKCCVGRCISVVCDTEKHNRMYENKIVVGICGDMAIYTFWSILKCFYIYSCMKKF
jgi:hypothetical protein